MYPKYLQCIVEKINKLQKKATRSNLFYTSEEWLVMDLMKNLEGKGREMSYIKKRVGMPIGDFENKKT